MDVPVGERAGRLQSLGQQLGNIDAAITGFKKSHRISIPTSPDAAMSLLVSMDVTTKAAQKQVLEMMDSCRQQIEDEMAALLKRAA